MSDQNNKSGSDPVVKDGGSEKGTDANSLPVVGAEALNSGGAINTGTQTVAGEIPNKLAPVKKDARKSDLFPVTFTKSPTGFFGLAYNVGESGNFEAKQALEIVNAGYGTFDDKDDLEKATAEAAE